MKGAEALVNRIFSNQNQRNVKTRPKQQYSGCSKKKNTRNTNNKLTTIPISLSHDI